MKRRISLLLSVIFGILSFTSCNVKSKEVKPGIYYLNGDTDKSYIVIGEDETIGFYNVDFSEMEKTTYEDYIIMKDNFQRDEQGKEKLTKEEEQKIRDNIDLNSQFLGKMNKYTIEDEEGILGLYIPVNNTELFMYTQFYPSSGYIVFDGFNYILKE